MTKTRFIILGCAFLLLAGFAYAAGSVTHEKEVTSADAEALARLLVREIRSSAPSAQVSRPLRGGAGNVHTTSIDIQVPASDFSPDEIRPALDAAVTRWGLLETFYIHGGPGVSLRTPPNLTACRAFLHFGSSRSHAFIDAVAYPFGESTRIEILVRTIE
jgi:hypothetical protein